MNKDSRILVAGMDTMEGVSLCESLVNSGFENILPSRDTDLRVYEKLDVFFQDHSPEYIFLVDGLSGGIKANQEMPASLMIDNLKVITNTISLAHDYRSKKLIYVASSCSYPKESTQPMDPTLLMTGPLEPTNSSYATAKLAGIELCRAYSEQYNNNFISVIPANIYGPGDDFESENAHVISAMIRKIHAAKSMNSKIVELWGTGKPKREFLYLSDFSSALIFIMKNYSSSEPLNVGTNEVVTIKQLSGIISEIIGFEGNIQFDETKPDGMMEKSLDSSVLLDLGFRPSYTLYKGIKETYSKFLESH